MSTEYTNNKDEYEFFDTLNNEKIKLKANVFIMKYKDIKEDEIDIEKENNFLKELYLIPSNKEFTLIGHYINNTREIKFMHTCGNIITYQGIKKDIILYCPKCNKNHSSIGEDKIRKFLDNNNIIYEREKTFDGCIYKNKLRFDFYIKSKNLLLEYDGEQHFKGWKNNKEDLKLIQERDNAKNEWVKNHKEYKLIRINYKQDLDEYLNDIFLNNIIDTDNLFTINI